MRPRLFLAIVKFAACVALLTFVVFNLGAANLALAKAKDESKWIEVHTAHFSVITDAGDKRGREVALRMEQMRSIFSQLLLKDKLKMPAPITVIALKSDQQYGMVAPAKQSMAGGFYVPGADRVYIVLNLFEADPWRAVAHPLAHYLLNYNYPPAQGWFDEGLAEYFGSIQISKQVEIGGDPELAPEWHEDVFEEIRRDPNRPQSLTQLLSSPVWLSMVDLFSMKHDGSGTREGIHNTLYYAQSWMVVHYLVNKHKLPEAGTYFDLVLNQKAPVEKAMVQAFDMSPAQMEDAVKEYFKSLSGLGIALDQAKKPNVDPVNMPQPDHFAPPFDGDDIGMVVSPVKDEEARAVIGDVMARVPEHRDQALRDLQQLAADPKDNEAARRGLAGDDLRQKRFDEAADELERAADLNPLDPWIWYYRSAVKYQRAQATRQQMQGLANMMQDLRAAADWYPELADAYNMLGMARVEGGGINSALEAQRQAIALAPRNVEYQFNLGQIYVAGKKWDLAREVFTRLKAGPDRAAAAAAKQQLDDLETLQKYGVRPQRSGANAGAAADANSSQDQDDEADAAPKPVPAKPGLTGPVRFLKGKIVSSDCSKAPEATVTILSGMTTYKLHASDYKSLQVIGEDQFSCEWKNRLVSVNYRAAGKNEGELVSVEVR
ncbi:MAG TPA: tetratricopeptide repeat protein [Terriglobales bacterium]|nr:tetratricopeptide repeat protein [Terriglobales bacterium]